jgi:hypothetical protein
LQVTIVASDRDTCWQFWDVVQDALELGDWATELLPYSKLRLARLGDEVGPFHIPETKHFTLAGTYEVMVAR